MHVRGACPRCPFSAVCLAYGFDGMPIGRRVNALVHVAYESSRLAGGVGSATDRMLVKRMCCGTSEYQRQRARFR